MILMEAQDDNYFEIELVVKNFQDAMTKIKYSSKPVVAAPYGMTLGGGTEVCLPAASIQASSETYMVITYYTMRNRKHLLYMKLVTKRQSAKRYQLLGKQDMQLLHLVQKQCIYLVTFQSMTFTLRRNLHMSLRAEKYRTEQKLMSNIY